MALYGQCRQGAPLFCAVSSLASPAVRILAFVLAVLADLAPGHRHHFLVAPAVEAERQHECVVAQVLGAGPLLVALCRSVMIQR